MNSAPNLVLVGPMGAGKSSVGRRLAPRFGLDFFDTDQAIAERAGASIPELFQTVGESGFREYERAVLATLLAGDRRLVSTGGGAVLDAENRALLQQRGFVIYLQASADTQFKRIGPDTHRPLLQNPDPHRVLRELTQIRDPLYREIADICFETDDYSIAETLAHLHSQLRTQWQCCGDT